MSKIFLSHTKADKPFVRKLAADLRRYGHTIWIDEAEINIGDSLIGKIREGLDSVEYVAVVLSEASIKSEWVLKELEIASNKELLEKRKVVLPIKIENVDLPGFLVGKLYGDFSNPEDYNENLKLLLRALGDSTELFENEEPEDVQKLKEELERAKSIIDRHEKEYNKVVDHAFSSKPAGLKQKIIDENKSNPKFAPINNVYAFEVSGIPVTLGYLLHVLRKIEMKGGHQFEVLLTMCDKWDEANRMVDAFMDMIKSDK